MCERRTRDELEGMVEDWVRDGCPGNGDLVDTLLDHLMKRAVAGAADKTNGRHVHLFVENVKDGNA
jgi:hypothetical protein